MPELRKDIVFDRWVILSTERSLRPNDAVATKESTTRASLPATSSCPFCVGNETQTPPEVFAIRSPQSSADHPGWQVRVVPNKFPALARDSLVIATTELSGINIQTEAVGAHEVIIETTGHTMKMHEYPLKLLSNVIETYKIRMQYMRTDERCRYVLLFKNQGALAGASLSHSHSQLLGLPVVPRRVREEMTVAYDYYRLNKRCISCDMILEEQKYGKRIIYENELFVAFCPFASRFPFEIWIMPKSHDSLFEKIDSEAVISFAATIKYILSALTTALENPQFNFHVRTAPVDNHCDSFDDFLHWRLEIMPRRDKLTGFEWGTGVYMNHISPEDAAECLRKADVPQHMSSY